MGENSPGGEKPDFMDKGWKKRNRIFYERWVKLASGLGGDAAVFGWGVAEATCWPVIPDFILAPMTFADRRKPWWSLAASGLGSALGGALLFGLARRFPAGSRRVIEKMPLVHDYHFEQVRQKLAKDKRRALFMQPWSGVPAKVVVVVGAEKGLLGWADLPLLFAARVLRMAAILLVARLVARLTRPFMPRFSLLTFLLYLLVFFPIWWQIVRRRSPKQ